MTGQWVHAVTRQPGEPIAKTAKELVSALVDGSPRLRAILNLFETLNLLEPVTREDETHRKMLIVESCPLNAWFIEVVLNLALIGTRTMHAKLKDTGRKALVDEFNNPTSQLKVLIITYDIGSVGLNLHQACNLVVLSAPGKSWSAEAQAFGRCMRVCSLSRSTSRLRLFC